MNCTSEKFMTPCYTLWLNAYLYGYLIHGRMEYCGWRKNKPSLVVTLITRGFIVLVFRYSPSTSLVVITNQSSSADWVLTCLSRLKCAVLLRFGGGPLLLVRRSNMQGSWSRRFSQPVLRRWLVFWFKFFWITFDHGLETPRTLIRTIDREFRFLLAPRHIRAHKQARKLTFFLVANQ